MKIRWPVFLKVFGKSAVDWYDAWLDMTLMGIIWLFAQLTVILGPAATFGVYYVVNGMVRSGEGAGVRGMFEGAKKYFLKSLAWGALNWLVALIAVVNYIFYSSVQSTFGLVARVLLVMLVVLWLLTQFYCVPFFMAQEQERVLLALRNGFFMALASLFFTLGLMIFVVIIVGLSAVFVLPAFLGVPMLIPVLSTRALYDRLETYGLRKKDPEPKDVR